MNFKNFMDLFVSQRIQRINLAGPPGWSKTSDKTDKSREYEYRKNKPQRAVKKSDRLSAKTGGHEIYQTIDNLSAEKSDRYAPESAQKAHDAGFHDKHQWYADVGCPDRFHNPDFLGSFQKGDGHGVEHPDGADHQSDDAEHKEN